MSNRLEKMLGTLQLRDLAGPRSFERGRFYFEAGAVEQLVVEGDTLLAAVVGSSRYQVEMRPDNGAIAHSCSCPMGRQGAFCKHCVAAALAYAEGDADAVQSRPSPLSLDEIRAELEELDPEALVSMLVEQAERDDAALERLRLALASRSRGRLDLASLRRAIEVAVDPGDFVSYREAYDWSCRVDEVIETIEGLVDDDHAAAVVELAEHALRSLEGARGLIDDSDGHLSVLSSRLERIHLAACKRARPNPSELAERLLRWKLESELEVFYDALDTHAEVLGEEGLARYAELARAEWEQVPELGPGDERDYGRRFRITRVMESLASAGGDADQLVDVLCRDLTLPYGFLRIAEVYRDAGRVAEAIDWAERGVEAFASERPDPRLQEFLADAYAAEGRHADALEVAWDRYADSPSLSTYRELKPYAEHLDEWPRRRERALGLLRKRAREAREEVKRRGYGIARHGDHSELVRILLWEGDSDAAWDEAQTGGCDEALWLELAVRRKADHPEDALRVYRERIEPTIARKSKADYADAVRLIEGVGSLLRRLGRDEELTALVAEIRATHARKRNLIALLDEARSDEVVASEAGRR